MRGGRWGVVGVIVAAGAACSSSSAPPAASNDWPMYGRDLLHTFSQTSSPITRDNVASLTVAWTFATTDAVSASPTVVGGVVYVGAWDGFFYALDAATGALKWKFQLDCQPALLPIPMQCLAPGQMEPDRTSTDGGIVTGSATVVGGRVYFGGGKTLYCLNAADGKLVWKHAVCGNPDAASCAADASDPTNIFSSPAVFDGKVIFGHTPDGAKGYRGGIVALDASTGNVVWSFETDPSVDANGNPTGGNNNRGCGSVWSSGAVDDNDRLVVFGTGDCQSDAEPPYHEAVLALDVDKGTVKWVYRPRMSDKCDFDFGASANILDLDGKRYVGIGGKDGSYYVLKAVTTNPQGELVWSKNVVFGGSSGGFIGSTAFDGQRIYGGTGLGDFGQAVVCNPMDPRDMMLEDPSYHVFDARTGNVVWEAPMSYTFAASTVGNGVVFNGVGSILPAALRVYDAKSGAMITSFKEAGAVNSGVTLVGRMAFFGTGNSFNGNGGGVTALKLP